MMKSEILPHSSVTKQGYSPKRKLGGSSFNIFFTSWRHLSRGILRGNSKEEPFMVLMFLCQHGRIYAWTWKMNVFVKPNELCRSYSNIVMARKRTFIGTAKERLTRSLVHLSSCQPVQPVSTLNIVTFSASFLTLWVPFLSTNCPLCRKKSILAKVSFDAKRG